MNKQVQWVDIPGYENLYQVSNTGLVRNIRKAYYGRILKQAAKAHSHWELVKLIKDGEYKSFPVHILMAKTFYQGDNHIVRHKDGNNFNNKLENIEVFDLIPAKRK